MNAQRAAKTAYNRIDQLAENAVLKLVSRALMAASSALMVWVAAQFIDMRDAQVRISWTLSTLEKSLDEKTSDRYTASSAERDWKAQGFRDNTQDADRTRIEGRIERIERRVFTPR